MSQPDVAAPPARFFVQAARTRDAPTSVFTPSSVIVCFVGLPSLPIWMTPPPRRLSNEATHFRLLLFDA